MMSPSESIRVNPVQVGADRPNPGLGCVGEG
jgi:hypothetical protein